MVENVIKQVITFHFVEEQDVPNGEHLLIITRYNQKWLLVHHKKRGIEFCGGKVELGETVHQAAIREAEEELGAIITEDDLHYIGQYRVTESKDSFTKDVFYAQVSKLQVRPHYFETWGPRLYRHLTTIPLEQQSFILRDTVVQIMIDYVIKKFNIGMEA